jgi:ABC-type molybdenum transport system ATPase subunit/photorepair protein PhrA
MVLIPTHCVRPSPWHAGALKRSYTNTLVHIPKSNVYRFGDSNVAAPVFRDVDWTVKEGQNWAVIGRGANQKTALLQVPYQKHDSSWQTTLTIAR